LELVLTISAELAEYSSLVLTMGARTHH
jgi:hypothetical protein